MPGPFTLTATASGSNYRQGSSYPPATYQGNDDGGSIIYVDRQKSGATFTTDTAYLRFSGSALAGQGTPDTATLKLWITGRQDGDAKYLLTAEYYDYGGSPSDSGDFKEEVTSPCVTPVRLNLIGTGAYVSITMSDLSGITTGTFGLRITLVSNSTAAPAGSNGVTITSHSGTNKPQLVVTTSSGGAPEEATPGPGTESDVALSPGRAIGRTAAAAIEADSAIAPGKAAARSVTAASSLENAVSPGRESARGVAPGVEFDEAGEAGAAFGRAAGPAVESDVAGAAGRAIARAVEPAIEVDSASSIADSLVARGTSPAVEFDSAIPASGAIARAVASAVELDSAIGPLSFVAQGVEPAIEIDVAPDPGAGNSIIGDVVPAIEFDFAGIAGREMSRTIEPAIELDFAFAVPGFVERDVFPAIEIDRAFDVPLPDLPTFDPAPTPYPVRRSPVFSAARRETWRDHATERTEHHDPAVYGPRGVRPPV